MLNMKGADLCNLLFTSRCEFVILFLIISLGDRGLLACLAFSSGGGDDFAWLPEDSARKIPRPFCSIHLGFDSYFIPANCLAKRICFRVLVFWHNFIGIRFFCDDICCLRAEEW